MHKFKSLQMASRFQKSGEPPYDCERGKRNVYVLLYTTKERMLLEPSLQDACITGRELVWVTMTTSVRRTEYLSLKTFQRTEYAVLFDQWLITLSQFVHLLREGGGGWSWSHPPPLDRHRSSPYSNYPFPPQNPIPGTWNGSLSPAINGALMWRVLAPHIW